MTSTYAAQSNRRNSQKSTGPATASGKERSRWNALTHGATARLLALPGEDREELEKERDAWVASRATDDPIERALAERAFEAWHQLGRTLRAQQGRVERQMRQAELVERQQAADAALELGNRLFHDVIGPSQCYPNRPPVSRTATSSGDPSPGAPDQPSRIVLRLESTAAGCRWLLARWNELTEILEAGECWLSAHRFRAIRLLGKQPLDAVVDRDVRRIFLACNVLCPVSTNPFEDLLREAGDLPTDRDPVLKTKLKQLAIEPYRPKDPAEARQVLTSLVERAVSQLQVLLAEHETREDEQAASAADRHAFDLDHDGELMRRYEASCDRSFHRALAQLRLNRKDAQSPPGRGMRKVAGETEQANGVILTYQRREETHEQSPVGPVPPSLERPLAGMGSVAVEPPPPRARVDGNLEPAAGNGPELRNEAVADFVERNDSATEPGNEMGPGKLSGPKLRNEPDAASVDRDDSAGRAVPHSPAVIPQTPPYRRRPRTPRPVMHVMTRRRLADSIEVPSRAAPGSERLR